MSNPRIVDELDEISYTMHNNLVTMLPVVDAGKLYNELFWTFNKECPPVGLLPLNGTRLITSLLVKLVGRPLEQVTTFMLPDDDFIQTMVRNGYVGVEVHIVVSYTHALTSELEHNFPFRLARNPVISKQFANYHQTHSSSNGGVFIPCIKEESFRAIVERLRVHGSSVYVDWRSSGLDDVFLNDNEVQHESTREMP